MRQSEVDEMARMIAEEREAETENARLETWTEEELKPGTPAKKPKPLPGWWPLLNPTQKEGFNDPSAVVFYYGGKASGKTFGALHQVVRHCYENHNALVLCVARSIRVINKGACNTLENEVLPAWKEGNRAPPDRRKDEAEGKLLDRGIGLEYSPAKLDPQTKDRTIWIRNRFGTKSFIIFIAIPHEGDIDNRIRGIQPSMVYFEEIDTCETPKYFRRLRAQLNRRKGITGPQQFVASFNPVGPSHWLYDFCYKTTRAKPREKWRSWPKDPEEPGIRRRATFSLYFVPFKENEKWLPPDYLRDLKETYSDDPVEYARLVEGRWMDQPAQDSIFLGYFNKTLHVKGKRGGNTRMVPRAGFPPTIGYDLGDVNHGIIFWQEIPTKDKVVWLAFDEIVHIKKQVEFWAIVKQLLTKMNFWCEAADCDFMFDHVSDRSAFNRFRSSTGSNEAAEIERLTKLELEENPDLYPRIKEPVVFQDCPRPEGSVEFRAKIMRSMFLRNEVYIDAHCVHLIDAFENIEGDRQYPLKPKKGSNHKHAYDAATYPIYHRRTGGGGMDMQMRRRSFEDSVRFT